MEVNRMNMRRLCILHYPERADAVMELLDKCKVYSPSWGIFQLVSNDPDGAIIAGFPCKPEGRDLFIGAYKYLYKDRLEIPEGRNGVQEKN